MDASAQQSTVIVTTEVTVPTTVTAPPVTTTATATVTEQLTVTATPTGMADDGTFGDGTYLVEKQVPPGNYQASSPNNGSMCYWEINDDAGGIIQYGTNSGVMFLPADAFSVRVVNCGTWRSAD